MRWLTLDHIYPAAFAALPHSSHDEWFGQLFGTCQFLDIALRAAGHEAKTLVRNFFPSNEAMLEEAKAWQPDIILSREAGRWSGTFLRNHFLTQQLICTCSHRVDDACLAGFDAVFSSFTWMSAHCHAIGVRCEYLPLAFGRKVLDLVPPASERDIPVAFIGGLGARIWDRGTRTMAAIAEAVPEFIWSGYWAGNESDIPESLKRARRPEVYGIDYYRMLSRTKIALNRHGEIAQGFGQNCRQFEATGMNCMLLTDDAGELVGHGIETGLTFCATYLDATDAIDQIRFYQTQGCIGGAAPERSREFVLQHHTFEARVPKMLEVIDSL